MRARTACSVRAQEHDAGDCVALFVIPCEELWLLGVEVDPTRGLADDPLRAEPDPAAYAQCAQLQLSVIGREIELSRNESVTGKVQDLPTGPLDVSVSWGIFGRLRTKVSLRASRRGRFLPMQPCRRREMAVR
jgi:hypothetical protein